LHCRHAERIAAGARRKKLALRGAALGIVAAVGVTAALMSASAIRGKIASRGDSEQKPLASSSAASDSANGSASPTVQQAGAQTAAVAESLSHEPPPAPRPDVLPKIAMGQTMLGDSVVAVRTDSNVTLMFDKPMTRTRIPDKFERFLRRTLGEVYGSQVETVLAGLPEGALIQGDLVNELPARGIHVPMSNDWKLSIYPETRPGQDGPLVVRYRVAVTARD
jgi:hypothetical protein